MFTKDTEYTVTNKVRELRMKKDLSQEALAEKVNVTRQTIISIEKGNYVPSVLLAMKIARTLSKNVEEIFSYEKI